MVRFRRRGQSQVQSVDELMSGLMRWQGSQSLNGLVITADRGYGRMDLLTGLLNCGVGELFMMPEHLLKCHPFVCSSFLCLGRADSEEESENPSSGDSGSEVEHEVQQQPPQFSAAVRTFIVDDLPNQCPSVQSATKLVILSYHGDGSSARRQRVTAVAVLERGIPRFPLTEKFSKILRFLYCLPSSMAASSETWIASVRKESKFALSLQRFQ